VETLTGYQLWETVCVFAGLDGRSWDNKMDAGDLLGKANCDGFGFRGVGRAGIEPWLRNEVCHVVHVLGPFFEIGREEVSGDDVGAWEERPYLKGTSGARFVLSPPGVLDGMDMIGGPDANPDGFGQFSSWRGDNTGNATVGKSIV